MRELVETFGLTAQDVFPSGRKTSSVKGTSVAPKYRNNATGETWTGRGLQPKWIQAAIASGKKLEDFTI